jgi:heat shock protein HspQ
MGRLVEGGGRQEARPLAQAAGLAKTRSHTKCGHISHPQKTRACFAPPKVHIARMERAEFFSSQAGRTIIAPRQTRARFSIGDVVRHRLFAFRGVVFDIDPVFANSEEWYQSIPEDIRPPRDQPFYHLLAENEDSSYVAYVSQGNLVADAEGGPVDHPTVRQLFESFKDGRYRMRRSLTH